MKRKTIKKIKKNKRKTIKKVKYGGSSSKRPQPNTGYNSGEETEVCSNTDNFTIDEYEGEKINDYLNKDRKEDTIFLFLSVHGSFDYDPTFTKHTSEFDIPEVILNKFDVFNKVSLGNLGCVNRFAPEDMDAMSKSLKDNIEKDYTFLKLCRIIFNKLIKDREKEERRCKKQRYSKESGNQPRPISSLYPHRIYHKEYKNIHLYNKTYSYDTNSNFLNKGVTVIYDGKASGETNTFDLQNELKKKGKEIDDGKFVFDTNDLLSILAEKGYKNVFIYDISCNYAPKGNFNKLSTMNRQWFW
jgi:hypothetical protein